MGIEINSEKISQIKKLSKRARVLGLSKQTKIPSQARHLVERADADKRHLEKDELETICTCCTSSMKTAEELIVASERIIKEAKSRLIQQYPELIKQGGKLYPEQRADAYWRVCQQFLRVIIYGVAYNCEEITDKCGMKALVCLYEILEVPTRAMLYVIREMWKSAELVLGDEEHEPGTKHPRGGFKVLIHSLEY
ncbi:MAG: phycobilisome polypeptide [Cyanobacteria bacterium]|nr:phycobilisome polypeptide [Cyanobacteriota bacterium]